MKTAVFTTEVHEQLERIGLAAQIFMENPMSTPLIPNWNRVISAIPDIVAMFELGVEEDSK